MNMPATPPYQSIKHIETKQIKLNSSIYLIYWCKRFDLGKFYLDLKHNLSGTLDFSLEIQ